MPFLPRPQYDWQLATRTLALGRNTLVMGILNVTPDSFSDGGHFYHPADQTSRAVEHGLEMLDRGAHLLDIGGESTRPDATPLSAAQEQDRVLPVLTALRQERPQAVLSVDTYHAATAREALAAGADVINDVSGLTWDPAMPAACAPTPCGVVLMHSRGTPQDWRTLAPSPPNDLLPEILAGLRQRVALAAAAGIASTRLVLDPGFGFGKLGAKNFTLHARLEQLHTLGLPVLVGTSRKGFLGQAIAPLHRGASPTATDRLAATLASCTAAVLAGAHLLRVHDVLPALEAAAIADAILDAH
ncbi:MAG: dihydropteroate synthase [Acidobacteriota bacterium]|nr:dihydropteroate synthase [Acidobacteriota bacterium]